MGNIINIFSLDQFKPLISILFNKKSGELEALRF